jgi:hypothetical protein
MVKIAGRIMLTLFGLHTALIFSGTELNGAARSERAP